MGSDKAWLIVALSWLLIAGCRQSAREPMLRDRIVGAKTSQYCRVPDACLNPAVLAYENGYDVTTFQRAQPQITQVRANDLAKYLQNLPMQAWPRGASILLTRSDDVYDERAVEQNFETARRVCRELGLNVQVRPGG